MTPTPQSPHVVNEPGPDSVDEPLTRYVEEIHRLRARVAELGAHLADVRNPQHRIDAHALRTQVSELKRENERLQALLPFNKVVIERPTIEEPWDYNTLLDAYNELADRYEVNYFHSDFDSEDGWELVGEAEWETGHSPPELRLTRTYRRRPIPRTEEG